MTHPINVDSPITEIIDDMNNLGFETTESCCGYDYPKQGEKYHFSPYICFKAKEPLVRLLFRYLAGPWLIEIRPNDTWRLSTVPVLNNPKKDWKNIKKAVKEMKKWHI